MNKALLVVIIAAVVIGAGVFLMRQSSQQATVSPSASVSASQSPTASPSVSPSVSSQASASPTNSVKEVTIRYTDSGYVPSTRTVSPGTKVTFVNESSMLMWTASAPHPTHTLLPEFDALKGFKVGESYSFTFNKIGEWPFHNHLKATHFGKVIVK